MKNDLSQIAEPRSCRKMCHCICIIYHVLHLFYGHYQVKLKKIHFNHIISHFFLFLFLFKVSSTQLKDKTTSKTLTLPNFFHHKNCTKPQRIVKAHKRFYKSHIHLFISNKKNLYHCCHSKTTKKW